MDYENYVSLVPLQDTDGGARFVARNLSSLASLANLAGLVSSTPISNSNYNLDSYRLDRQIDPDTLKIKEFAESFKCVKTKLKNIEETIQDLEKKRDEIKFSYEEVAKKVVEYFGFDENNPLLSELKNKTINMIDALNLDLYYDERSKLHGYYRIAVPLLQQVREEFFAESKNVPSCPICFEKNVSFVAIPCGHCLCEDCRKKIIATCFQCRAAVLKLNRVYID